MSKRSSRRRKRAARARRQRRPNASGVPPTPPPPPPEDPPSERTPVTSRAERDVPAWFQGCDVDRTLGHLGPLASLSDEVLLELFAQYHFSKTRVTELLDGLELETRPRQLFKHLPYLRSRELACPHDGRGFILEPSSRDGYRRHPYPNCQVCGVLDPSRCLRVRQKIAEELEEAERQARLRAKREQAAALERVRPELEKRLGEQHRRRLANVRSQGSLSVLDGALLTYLASELGPCLLLDTRELDEEYEELHGAMLLYLYRTNVLRISLETPLEDLEVNPKGSGVIFFPTHTLYELNVVDPHGQACELHHVAGLDSYDDGALSQPAQKVLVELLVEAHLQTLEAHATDWLSRLGYEAPLEWERFRQLGARLLARRSLGIAIHRVWAAQRHAAYLLKVSKSRDDVLGELFLQRFEKEVEWSLKDHSKDVRYKASPSQTPPLLDVLYRYVFGLNFEQGVSRVITRAPYLLEVIEPQDEEARPEAPRESSEHRSKFLPAWYQSTALGRIWRRMAERSDELETLLILTHDLCAHLPWAEQEKGVMPLPRSLRDLVLGPMKRLMESDEEFALLLPRYLLSMYPGIETAWLVSAMGLQERELQKMLACDQAFFRACAVCNERYRVRHRTLRGQVREAHFEEAVQAARQSMLGQEESDHFWRTHYLAHKDDALTHHVILRGSHTKTPSLIEIMIN